MKKLLLVLPIVFALVAYAYADETSGATYSAPNEHPCCEGFAEFLNEQECIDHTHQYDKYDPDYELGIKGELVVYEGDPDRQGVAKMIPDEVRVDTHYDFSNENGGTYVVAKYNLWDLFKKK